MRIELASHDLLGGRVRPRHWAEPLLHTPGTQKSGTDLFRLVKNPGFTAVDGSHHG
jgi:hypothetical protein